MKIPSIVKPMKEIIKRSLDGKNHSPEEGTRQEFYEEKPEDIIKDDSIIEYDGKVCLFTRRRWSYKVRGVLRGSFEVIEGGTNDKNKFLSLASKIHILGRAPRVSVENESFWKEYLSTFK